MADQYRLDFITPEIPVYEEKNNKSARNHSGFVTDQLNAMCSAGILSQVSKKPTCVSPLTVASRILPDGSEKLRLCFDGSRHVNRFLKPLNVKLSHFPKAAELLSQGDFQVSLDLKSFYYHLGIAPEHQQYLGVASDQEDGSRRYYQCTVLAFGIAPAASIMTRLVKPLISHLASFGVKVSIYLDDLKINASSKSLAWKHYQLAKEVFTAAGFVISVEKSDEFSDISQTKMYLGFLMDSVRMIALASEEKIFSVKEDVKNLLTHSRVGVKDLAKVTGKIASLKPALGNFVLLVSRSAYKEIQIHSESKGWYGYLEVTSEIKTEFSLFLSHCDKLNGNPLSEEFRQKSIQEFLRSSSSVADDASEKGVCAYDIQHPSKFFFQEQFSSEESSLSSGHRELLTVKKAFESNKLEPGSSICWYTDSMNLVAFWEKGSPKPAIQSDMVDLFLQCRSLNISLRILHLSREDPRIQGADLGSREFDLDDWGIDHAAFDSLSSMVPSTFTLDPFALPSNARVNRFFSLFNFPGAAAVDAFSMPWDNEVLFACPPVGKLIATWKKIILSTNCSGVLVFPGWKSCVFWPVIFPDGRHPSWPAIKILSFFPYIERGQNYAGSMQGKNVYPFIALFFNTSILAPTLPLCLGNCCSLVT